MFYARRIISGLLVFTLSSVLSLLSLVPLAPLLAEAQATIQGQVFTDVPASHPNLEAITYLKGKDVIGGYGDGHFAPDNTINRAEFMKIIVGSVVTNPAGGKCFKDVGEEWFAPYICEAKKRGIVDGYGDGTFRPDLNINIAEASKIVTKAFGVKTDAGTGNGGVAPAGAIWYKPFVTSLAAKSAIPVSIDYPEKKLTRGEMAEMAWRMKAGIETKPTKTFETLIADLPNISSCAELQEKISLQSYKQNRFAYPMMMKSMNVGAIPDSAPPTASAPAPTAAADEVGMGAGTGAASADAFSSTNVQVEGVDEADIIKNDGQYIYLIKGRSIRIVQATPATAMKELSRVTVDETSFTPSEMFVDGNVLVVVGNSYASGSQTVVYEYDVTDRSNVKQVRRIAFDGNYVSSRRIGNYAYFVMNAYPKYEIMGAGMNTGTGATAPTSASSVPKYSDSKTGKTMPVVGCSSIRVFPRYDEPNFLVVAGVPLNTSGDASITRQAYLGSGSTIYSSLDSLYVATQKYEYDESRSYNFWAPPSGKSTTVFYRFGLDNGAISYKTHGAVEGTLLNQFSMDESGDAFRVVTSQGNSWSSDTPMTNRLSILDRNNLATVLGKVDDIGKGEQIKAVRFMGKRAYVVTFKNIDPFFVIDVADATAPKILGELKIPGYSDYLQPYDENHIIGFGKNADETIDADKVHSANAVYYTAILGMKIALFDVSDVAQPKEMFKEIIGDRGTDSPVLTDHRALLFDKNKGLLAFPVTVAEIKDKDPSHSVYDGDVVFRGAYVYHLDLTNGFVLKGKITHEDAAVTDASGGASGGAAKMMPYYVDHSGTMIQRLLYIGQSLYSVSMAKVTANSLSDMSAQGSVDLAKEPDNGNGGGGYPLPM